MSIIKLLLPHATKLGGECCTSVFDAWIRGLSLLHGIMSSQHDGLASVPPRREGPAKSGADHNKLWLNKQPSSCSLCFLPWCHSSLLHPYVEGRHMVWELLTSYIWTRASIHALPHSKEMKRREEWRGVFAMVNVILNSLRFQPHNGLLAETVAKKWEISSELWHLPSVASRVQRRSLEGPRVA